VGSGWVLVDFGGFWCVRVNFREFWWFLVDFGRGLTDLTKSDGSLWWVLVDSVLMKFLWVLLGSGRFWWVVVGSGGFWWRSGGSDWV
jgi:hypothetical protein